MTLSRQLQSTASLLDATRAVSNWRALLLAGGTALAVSLLSGLTAITGSPALALLGGLASVLVLFYGSNAVGIMLMDACRMGVAAKPGDAIRRALSSAHRVLGVALTALAGLLALVLLVALALVVCKIPVLGPLLYAFVLPAAALVLGLAALALLYVYLPLAACAVWTGASVTQAAAHLLAIVRRRLVTVILQEFVLTLIVLVAGTVIGAVLLLGAAITASLSAGILGPDALYAAHPAHLAIGLMMGFAGSGHVLAALVGFGVLFALAGVVPGLILLQGFCQIYLDASDTLASDVAGPTGDDTLNTAARLRAADEAAQAQQREQATAPGAATGTRVEPSGHPDAAVGGPPAEPGPASAPAPAPALAPAPASVGGAAEAPPPPAPSPSLSAAPGSGQQSLGFGDDAPARASAPDGNPDAPPVSRP
ncbi:MAG: hypothetical protein QM617_08315 [Comamonas sp.]